MSENEKTNPVVRARRLFEDCGQAPVDLPSRLRAAKNLGIDLLKVLLFLIGGGLFLCALAALASELA